MSSFPRSDSDNGFHGRVRAATFPPRVGRRASENHLDRDDWYGKSLKGRRNTSPVGIGRDRRFSLLLKKPDSRQALQKKTARGDGTSPTWRKGSPIGNSYESGSGTSRSGGGVESVSTPRWARRRHRKSWEDVGPATRQQRFVTAMFALVVVLASVQIIGLVVHPPSEGKYHMSGLPVDRGDAAGHADSTGSGIRRRTDGLRKPFLRSGGGDGGRDVAKGGGLNSGDREMLDIRGQPQGLSLSNPRAFEMVAADMGHLKDTVEKLDLAFRETMNQQAKDLAAVMDQLGLPPTQPAKKGSKNSPDAASKQRFGKSGGSAGESRSPPSGQSQQMPNVVAAHGPPVSGGVGGGVGGGAGNGKGGGNSGLRLGPEGSGGGVWNAYSRGVWVNGQWVPKVLLDESSPDMSNLVENQRRVLLLSERRSGGGAVGGVLNADPRVFYVADPCRMGGGPEALSGSACALAVSRLLACQPTINDIRNIYSFPYIVERSLGLSELEQTRWNAGGTNDENDERLRTLVVRKCRESKVVVVKETRLPEVLSKVSTTQLGTEFLHVVRDPRAAIHGLAESWEGSKNEYDRAMAKDCTELATKLCSFTEKKLAGLTSLGKQRFRVLKYEMVLEAPFAMIKSVYTWLELGKIPPEVTIAITDMSAKSATPPPPGMAAWEGSRRTLARFEWATRWAVEMPAFRRQQVQEVCEPLLIALGYDEPEEIDQPLENAIDAAAAAAAAAAATASSDGGGGGKGIARATAKKNGQKASGNSVPIAGKSAEANRGAGKGDTNAHEAGLKG